MARASFVPKVFLGVKNLFRSVNFQTAYVGEICLTVLAGVTAYAYVALFSFYPFDPSGIAASFPQRKILNLAGAVGAYLAGFFVSRLGVAAFLFPALAFAIAVVGFRSQTRAQAVARGIGLAGIFLTTVLALAHFWGQIHFAGVGFPASGEWGFKLHSVCVANFGAVGSMVLCASLFLASVLLFAQKTLIKPFSTFCKTKTQAFLQSFKKAAVQTEPAVFSRNDIPILTQPTPIMQEDFSHAEDFEEYAAREVEAEEETEPLHYEKDQDYETPPLSIFKITPAMPALTALQRKEFESTAKILTTTFEDFGIKGEIVAIQPGPVVTVFEFQPDAGTKLAKINSLVDDIALSLRVDSIIMHPVRGKRAVGIQVPNQHRELVRLGDVLQSKEFLEQSSPLTLALGKTISGEPICADLTKMPHLLTAGSTGSGKSVAVNALLCSVIMKASPKQVRMILVDPKMLELSVYEGTPHLLMPVITEPVRAAMALKWAIQEMERRYKLMQHAQVRNVGGFNELVRAASRTQLSELAMIAGEEKIEEIPFILIVIDELADLMMTAPKEVESSIQRLAQKARASGIHLVLATQRPSVDIITGVIKANLPCRAAFQVVSKHDSRTILDQIGADKLLGNGDMLLQRPGTNRLERIQGAFISDEEVLSLVSSLKTKSPRKDYDLRAIRWIDEEAERNRDDKEFDGDALGMAADDPKYDDALQIAQQQGAVSASYLQRQLKIGYNRAARIVETMEAQGLVAKADGAKPRRWLGVRD